VFVCVCVWCVCHVYGVYVCARMRACFSVRVGMHVCALLRVCVRVFVQGYVCVCVFQFECLYVHLFFLGGVRVCMRTCACVCCRCVCVFVFRFSGVCVSTCVGKCVCVFVCACVSVVWEMKIGVSKTSPFSLFLINCFSASLWNRQ